MNKKTAYMFVTRRRKLLIKRNHLLIDRLDINTQLRQLNKELNSIDNLIVQEDE